MKELQIFKNDQFGEIRINEIDGQVWFCLKDICKALEIKNVSDCKERLNPKGVVNTDTLTNGGTQKLLFINESNLYKTIFQSRKEEAEKFQDWVTDEVLPTIRKHGMYATEELINNPDLLIQVATELKKERAEKERLKLTTKKQEQIINELKPKADYTDLILKNKGLVTITQIAKDYGMSGQELNNKLHELKVQYKQSGQWLLYSSLQNNGYTHSETINITRTGGVADIKMITKFTQKGRLFLYDLLKQNYILPLIERS